MGAGQFCTNPSLILLPAGEDVKAIINSATEALNAAGEQTMLTSGIAQAYHSGQGQVAATEGVTTHVAETASGRQSRAAFNVVTPAAFAENPHLAHEVFGPIGIAVLVDYPQDIVEIAKSFEGQLTATVHMDKWDIDLANDLLPVLERKAGRVLFNGLPTGVEVADSMVHVGPYPTSTNFDATSIGTLSFCRSLRPVCFQNMPDGIKQNF